MDGREAQARRVNYSQGDALVGLTKAVEDWLGKKGDIIEADETISCKHYCARVGIPEQTFRKYVCDDVEKRRMLGTGVGISKVIDADTENFLVDVLRRKDRANAGMSRAEAIDMLQDLHPAKTRKSLARAFDRNIRPDHKHELTGVVKAQASTEKRSAITMEQQYRWHSAVDAAYAMMRERNTGLTPDGRSFGEVMPYFVVGGDETCFLASSGEVKIIGDKEKPKHEVNTAGSRTSITVYRSGSAAGEDGPTGFLPAGINRKAAYTDEFLVKHGAAPGSTIVMTPTGYMTEDGWVRMAPFMAKGIRSMKVICDNPDWWVVKILDGFGPHTSSLEAMQVFSDAKIIILKEEGDTSHVCQAYDQECAKADKRSMRTSLALLRQTTQLTKGVIDAWQLVNVALAAVRELEASTWIASFKKVSSDVVLFCAATPDHHNP